MNKIIVLFLVILCSVKTSNAQYNPWVEWADNRISGYFDRMDYWWKYCYEDKSDRKIDSLRNASGRIYDFIQNIIVKYPSSITADFPASKEKGLHYITSEDNNMRIYSWQAKMEGHNKPKYEFRDVAGFNTPTGRKEHNVSNGTEGGFCSKITVVHTKDNINLYIANYFSIQSGEMTETLKAYAIINSQIKEMSVFQEGTKTPKHLWRRYSTSLKDGIPEAPAIHFSSDKRKLYVPEVEQSGGKQELSGKFSIFVFDGYKYVLQNG